jgi:hypothetical protein
MSTALGDDLAFEKVLSVQKTTDVVSVTTVKLDEQVEDAILSNVVSGTDEFMVRLYRSLSMMPSEFEVESLVGSISDVFRAKQNCSFTVLSKWQRDRNRRARDMREPEIVNE